MGGWFRVDGVAVYLRRRGKGGKIPIPLYQVSFQTMIQEKIKVVIPYKIILLISYNFICIRKKYEKVLLVHGF